MLCKGEAKPVPVSASLPGLRSSAGRTLPPPLIVACDCIPSVFLQPSPMHQAHSPRTHPAGIVTSGSPSFPPVSVSENSNMRKLKLLFDL